MSTAAELKTLYHKGKKRKILGMLLVFVALIVVIVVSISLGSGSPRFTEAVQVISAKLFPFLNLDPGPTTTQTIVWTVRFPRVVLAVVAGAGLAAAGATMQGVLRNPLVSSYILGVSAAAGFGASLAMILGVGVITFAGGYLIVGNAFIFCFIALVLVYLIARVRGMTSETVILAGVAVGFLFSALLSLVQYVAPESEAVSEIVFWLMGGLNGTTWENVLICAPIVVVVSVLMIQQSWNINVMSMGEDVAKSLGVNSKRLLTVNMLLETLATASIIAFTGVIGFVDLVAPHIARMLIGSDHRYLIPCSMLVGALVLLSADTVGRLIIAPSELPVGIVTSLLGVPFFIYLLVNRRRQSFH
jgi:iron complex transport system permease protein